MASKPIPLNVVAQPPAPSQPWYASGLRFTCAACGNCCSGGPGYVWISENEIRRLAGHLNLSPEQIVERYCRKLNGRFSLRERRTPQGNYDCIFLVERPAGTCPTEPDAVLLPQRICSIYPVRPLQCRTWPFWDGNLEDFGSWQRAGKRCPGIDQGTHYTCQQIESVRTARDWPDRSPGSE